jgi:hypothetical protein
MFGARPASELARQVESLAGLSDAQGVSVLIDPLCAEVELLLAAIAADIPA